MQSIETNQIQQMTFGILTDSSVHHIDIQPKSLEKKNIFLFFVFDGEDVVDQIR